MAQCPAVGNAEVVRITRVDSCGRPVCGPGNAMVIDCFSQIQITANINQPDPVQLTNARGQNCLNRTRCPSLDGYSVQFDFFAASPELVEMLTGQRSIFDWRGRPVGWANSTIRCKGGFALEAWNGIGDDEPCDPDAPAEAELSWYTLIPWINQAIMGDLTLGGEGVTFTVTGNARKSSLWGVGPWNDVQYDANGNPGPLLAPVDPEDYSQYFMTDVPMPIADCDPVEVLCESPTESPS